MHRRSKRRSLRSLLPAVLLLVGLGLPGIAVAATTSTGETCDIVGTSGGNTLTGTSGSEVICGLGGNDTINGGGGNDIIDGGTGNDTLSGGGGNDTLIGGGGSDTMTGGTGTDTTSYASSTCDVTATIDGLKNDGCTGEQDKISTDTENLTGGTGSDALTGSGADNTLSGGGGNDTLSGGSGSDTLSGGGGNDTLSGSTGGDTLVGGDGNDTLFGGDGGDTLLGGAGADGLVGDAGADNLSGGGGTDNLSGGANGDTLNGGTGTDTLSGGEGTDTTTYAGTTCDVVATIDGVNNDGCVGEGDTIGTDTENLTGGSGDDTLTGSSSDNVLSGGDGTDALFGGDGGDTLRVGTGTEELASGGSGTDACMSPTSYIQAPLACEGEFGAYGRIVVTPPPPDPGTSIVGWGDFGYPPVAPVSDGSFLVGGKTESGDLLLGKVKADGTMDTSLDGDGWYLVAHSNEWLRDPIIDGEEIFLTAVGTTTRILNLSAAGVLDTTFDTDGEADPGTGISGIYAQEIRDGRIKILGNDLVDTEWFLRRVEMDKTTGAVLATVSISMGATIPRSAAFLSDGSVAAAFEDGSVKVLAAADLAEVATIAAPTPPTDMELGQVEVFQSPDGFVRSLLFGTVNTAYEDAGWAHLLNDEPLAVTLEGFGLTGSATTEVDPSGKAELSFAATTSDGCVSAGLSTPLVDQVMVLAQDTIVGLTRCEGIYVWKIPQDGGAKTQLAYLPNILGSDAMEGSKFFVSGGAIFAVCKQFLPPIQGGTPLGGFTIQRISLPA